MSIFNASPLSCGLASYCSFDGQFAGLGQSCAGTIENSLVNAQITVDYDDTKTMADAYQVSHSDLLKRLQKSGVSSVALYQLSLANLRDNGTIVIQSRKEAEDDYPDADWKKYPLAYRFLITANAGNTEMLPQIYEHLRDQSQGSLPPKIISRKGFQISRCASGTKTLKCRKRAF